MMPPLPSLDELLVDIQGLPSLPTIVTDLLQALGDRDVHVDRLAAGIARDQAMSARVLAVANSPFYGVQNKVGTIHDAIIVLGIGAVARLVAAAAISGLFTPAAGSGFDLTRFWRHGMGTALCARALAAVIDLEPQQAFTTGLLHDIGQLILATLRPEVYRRSAARREERDCLMHEAELELLGYDHARVGEALAERWRLPADMSRAVGRHHAPDGGGEHALTDVIHLADILAHALDLAGDPAAMVPPVDPCAWRRLDLDGAALKPMLAAIEREHESYCLLLA